MTLPATDRMREAAASLDGRVDRLRGEGRRKALEAAARIRAAHIAGFPCRTRDEAVRVHRALAREVFSRLAIFMGPLETASFFASLAKGGAVVPASPAKARAVAEAERLFRPANDEVEQ